MKIKVVMMGTLNKEKEVVLANRYLRMEVFMKVNGRMTCKMEQEL